MAAFTPRVFTTTEYSDSGPWGTWFDLSSGESIRTGL